MNFVDQKSIDPMKEMIRIGENILQLPRRHFRESYRSTTRGELIYNSQWCRVNIVWGGWDNVGGNSISIYYGRLHAPDEKATMIWNGEECRCWHNFDYALHFLDGQTPTDAAMLSVSHPITDPFYEDEFRKQYHYRQPEWLAQMHVAIWQYYGTRFFELFDLRRPELWDQYRRFLKEVYDIEGRSPAIKPPLDKVC